MSLLISEIVAEHLKDRTEIKIYDPTSGSGSLLINIGESAARYIGGENNIKYYAQELKENTYNLTRMNLVMRGILPDNIVTRCGDTLEEDWPYFDDNDPVNTYEPLYVDAVVSNPPYSQAWNPADKEADPRYARFGLAPKGKADYAFLLHDLYHLKPDGIMTIILPHGVLFRGGEEGTIRKNLIEQNHIDTIIGLPSNIFFGTGIPTIIMVLKQHRDNTDVLIIDASKGFAKEGKNNKLRACDIKKIVDVVTARVSVEKFSRVVSRDEIRANDYNLNIPRYVDSSEKAETWDIYATMFGGIPESELDELNDYWNAFPHLKDALFTADNDAYCHLAVDDLKAASASHPDVTAFKARYQAYQPLDDNWNRIAIDLEVLQTEGFSAVKQVDPNMVLKKKNGKDQEIQEGWTGHVLPFDLVQQKLLADDLQALRDKEARVDDIAAELETQLDNLSEEDKEQAFVNDAKDAFVAAEVKKALKAKEADADTLAILKKVDTLFTEEKSLKKQIKDDEKALHLQTKATIEALSDEEACALLKQKWITPLTDNLLALPDAVIDTLVTKLDALSKKYSTTFAEIDQEITDTENALIAMLDDLTGNDYDMQGIAELKKLLGGA